MKKTGMEWQLAVMPTNYVGQSGGSIGGLRLRGGRIVKESDTQFLKQWIKLPI